MRKTPIALALLVGGMATGLLVAPWKTKPVMADEDEGQKIAIRDDCDPNGWPGPPPGGGCALKEGDVTRAEFEAELFSPALADAFPIGHQAWRNDPSYLKIEEGETVNVRNRGGRGHTFTEVQAFGGGRVPRLNGAMVPAPQCLDPATAPVLPPGARMEVSGLAVGNHRFQCCLHPWMRAIVKVKAEEDHDNHDH